MKRLIYFALGTLAAICAGLLWVFNQKPYPIFKPGYPAWMEKALRDLGPFSPFSNN